MKTSCIMIAVLAVLGRGTSSACVGSACMQIWSTADGGGALTVQWDFANTKVQTFQSFCAPDNSLCLYTTIDPGFMAPPVDDDPADSYYRLVDDTRVTVELVAADAAVALNVNGKKLNQPGDKALLGTMPTIHVHPSWQVVVPGDQLGDYNISYKLTTDSPRYTASQAFTAIVTNVPPPEQSPTATPTAEPTAATKPCAGDCNGDAAVTVNELIVCVNMALGTLDESACPAGDTNGDGSVSIDEIVSSVNAALNGCPAPPAATLAEIQQTIFTPRCATQFCHDAQSHTGNLVLTPDSAYTQLVGVPPDILSARQAGLLRVSGGAPEQSFLLIKLMGPPPDQGSRMPLTGAPLSQQQIELIRQWILQGAQP